jgi:Methyltransferase domain
MQIPWFAKIGAKMLLARMPVTYAGWRRLHLFLHGAMLDPGYAFNVFSHHYAQAQSVRPIPSAFVGLELGPGDSLYGALAAAARGANRVYLIDRGDYAHRSVSSYLAMIEYMRGRGLRDAPTSYQDVEAIEAKFGIEYRTRGIASLREIPDSSVDFVWSHAALEHVRLGDFMETCSQTRRIMRSGAVASHRVDLMDHLGGALNNLRFTDRIWESSLMADSGFYTNRIRCQQMLEIFERAGFHVAWVAKESWDRLPIERQNLAKQFRSITDEELKISAFDAVLVPK